MNGIKNIFIKIKTRCSRMLTRIREWNLMGINLSLIPSALFNLVYILSNIISGLFYKSLWAFFLTTSHLLLLLMRLYIFRAARSGEDSYGYKMLKARNVGRMLLLLDIPALMMCVYAVIFETGGQYGKTVIVIFASYAIYSLIASLVGIIRSLRVSSPLLFAARNLTLTTALFSLFNLAFSIISSITAHLFIRRALLVLCTALFSAAVLSSAFSLIFLQKKEEKSAV